MGFDLHGLDWRFAPKVSGRPRGMAALPEADPDRMGSGLTLYLLVSKHVLVDQVAPHDREKLQAPTAEPKSSGTTRRRIGSASP
jgi:hypothetical protein